MLKSCQHNGPWAWQCKVREVIDWKEYVTDWRIALILIPLYQCCSNLLKVLNMTVRGQSLFAETSTVGVEIFISTTAVWPSTVQDLLNDRAITGKCHGDLLRNGFRILFVYCLSISPINTNYNYLQLSSRYFWNQDIDNFPGLVQRVFIEYNGVNFSFSLSLSLIFFLMTW